MRSSALLQRQSSSSTARRRLLIVECGAPGFSAHGAEAFEETIAVAQLEGEPAIDFADRVLHRIATAERSGHRFDVVTLHAGIPSDSAASAGRRLIALAVAAHAQARSPHCELSVIAPPNSPAELREQLLGLVDELVLSAEHEPLPVRVRFDAPKRDRQTPSGVFFRPAAPGTPRR